MTTTPAANSDIRTSLSQLFKLLLAWVPIVVGVVHQLLMFSLNIDRIYVFLDPPKYIYPFVTLELGWWAVLTLLTSLLCVLAYTNRIRPHRIVYPFYLYLLFLLILVKPI